MKTTTVRVSQEQYEAASQNAQHQGQTPSAFIRAAIDNANRRAALTEANAITEAFDQANPDWDEFLLNQNLGQQQ